MRGIRKAVCKSARLSGPTVAASGLPLAAAADIIRFKARPSSGDGLQELPFFRVAETEIDMRLSMVETEIGIRHNMAETE